MSLTSYKAVFGGREQVFDFRLGEVGELEMLCGAGIGAVALRLVTGQFKLADIRETHRLGLIGGGMLPSEADFLVGRYIDGRPINENVGRAALILQALFDGNAVATKDDPPGEAKGSGDPATSPPSSPPASSWASARTAPGA